MSTLYIYCAGGLGREVLDIAKRINGIENRWSNYQFIDDFNPVNTLIDGVMVKSFEDLLDIQLDQMEFSIVIAHGDPRARLSILEKLKLNNLSKYLVSIVSVDARVSLNSSVGLGTIICPGAHISVNAIVGINCLINCNSIIGHDVILDDNVVISSQVNLGGNVKISKNAFVGMGALLREGISIGPDSIIGMGSSVHKDVPENTLCIGNPARVIRKATNTHLYNN
jgi:sugar O-acyltransferase (sialic acid O-acetyltransferase NeuD family)